MSEAFVRFSARTDILLEALSMYGRVEANGHRARVKTRRGGLWITPVYQARFDVFLVEVEDGTEYEKPEHAHSGDEYIITLKGEMDLRTGSAHPRTYRAGDMVKVPRGVIHAATAYRFRVEQIAILDPHDPAFRGLVPFYGT
jgi:quercetin dioxygenase-like cupin family protein